ncbi:MAG: hypothetical protein KA140_01690 [Caldisericia bacterium]|nr:hypothetical protein [Caldisericia bacterium]
MKPQNKTNTENKQKEKWWDKWWVQLIIFVVSIIIFFFGPDCTWLKVLFGLIILWDIYSWRFY